MRREGPGKQMDGCVHKRNKTTARVCAHVHAASCVSAGTPPGAAVSGEHGRRGGGGGGGVWGGQGE